MIVIDGRNPYISRQRSDSKTQVELRDGLLVGEFLRPGDILLIQTKEGRAVKDRE